MVGITLNNLAALSGEQGKYEEAPLYVRALEICEKLLGHDHPELATTLIRLAFVYINQGKYEEAEPLCKRALEIREKLLGHDHPELATTLINLAFVLDKQAGKVQGGGAIVQTSAGNPRKDARSRPSEGGQAVE